jgi:hypothetical protein
MQTLWEKTINNIDSNNIDLEDSLRQMLNMDQFKFIKEKIEDKLKEIEQFKSKNVKTQPKEIKLEVGKFYKTFNGSIVFCASKPMEGLTTNRLVVISGGSNLQVSIVDQVMYGAFNLGDCYGAEENGVSLYTIGLKTDKFDMDIVEEISVDFKK